MKYSVMLFSSVVMITALMTSVYGSPVAAPAASTSHARHVVPFKFKNDLVEMVEVQAYLDGKKVNAVLDSGTGGIVVNKSLIGALGISLGRTSIKSGIGGQGTQRFFPLRLHSVRLGPIHLENVSALATNLNYVSSYSGSKVYAFLGYPFFANHVITVDYPAQRVLIYSKHKPLTCQHPIPISIEHHVPVVTAKVRLAHSHEVQTLHLIVDLGSAHAAVILGGKALATKAARKIMSRPPFHAKGTGDKAYGWSATVAKLEVGGNDFHDLPALLQNSVQAFNGKFASGSLGIALWKSGSITFDYPAGKICINTALGEAGAPPNKAPNLTAPVGPAGWL